MTIQYSLSSEALAIPDIVSVILDEVCLDSTYKHTKTLLSCARINRLWYNETIRRLWSDCDDVPRRTRSSIGRLVVLNPSRQQILANHITRLNLTSHSYGNPYLTWKLPNLAHLSFPRLRKLYLVLPEDDDARGRLPDISQFIQPRLRTVHISTGWGRHSSSEAANQWISTLAQRSSHFNIFILCCRHPDLLKNLSPSVLISFLESSYSLTGLRLELTTSIPDVVFMTIAKKPSLKWLYIVFSDTCLKDDLRSSAQGSLFKTLETLICIISAHNLERLMPHLANLTSLNLTSGDDPKHIIRILNDDLPLDLKILNLHIVSLDPITVPYLMSFLEKIPKLRLLQLRTDDFFWSPTIGNINDKFNDDVMENLAATHPELESIQLFTRGYIFMTERSLISLGKHCPLLRECTIQAKINSSAIAEQAASGLWKQLYTLKTLVDSSHYHDFFRESGPPSKTEEEVARAIPSIKLVQIRNGTEL